MAEVIDFRNPDQRVKTKDPAVGYALRALDCLGLALDEHNHVWTDEQKQLYCEAVRLLLDKI